MDSRFWTFINWGVLLIVTLFMGWMILGFLVSEDEQVEDTFTFSEECIDIIALEGFEYEACYDAYSEMIFLKVNRGKSNYDVEGVNVFFVDLASQSYELEDVPEAGEKGAYKISANRNPGTMNVRLDVVRNFAGTPCGNKDVFVDYCPVGTGGGGVGVLITPIDGVSITDFIEVEDMANFDSDIIVMDLVEKEAIWESVCKSNWDCGEWEACDGSVRKRDCKDLNACPVSIDSPVGVERCDGGCIEDWECEWSSCEDGVSVPECGDSNDCGTSYNVPKKLPCAELGKCVPDLTCSDWTECGVDYNFLDLVGDDRIIQLDGIRSRICTDDKGCVETLKEEESCSVGVDIYTERFERCGEDYVGIYDVLTEETLAILKEGSGGRAYLNIYFDDQSGVYCDYCFDGEMNGDEEGIDCGGSCKECDTGVRYYEKEHWWDFIF